MFDSIPNLSYQSGIKRKQLIIRGEILSFCILKDDLYQKLIFAELQLNYNTLLTAKKSNAHIEILSFQVVIGISLL